MLIVAIRWGVVRGERGNYTNCFKGEPGFSFLFRILNASCFCV